MVIRVNSVSNKVHGDYINSSIYTSTSDDTRYRLIKSMIYKIHCEYIDLGLEYLYTFAEDTQYRLMKFKTYKVHHD